MLQNQTKIIKSGAIVIVGIVWETTNIGYKHFLITLTKSMIIPNVSATNKANINPKIVSYNVTNVLSNKFW